MGDTCGDNRFELFGISEQLDCSDCVNHGGDWDCDHVHCRKGTDTISRAAAIDVIEAGRLTKLIDAETAVNGLKALPSAQSELVRKIYAIGYTGKEGRIYIGGRLFAVRELAQ